MRRPEGQRSCGKCLEGGEHCLVEGVELWMDDYGLPTMLEVVMLTVQVTPICLKRDQACINELQTNMFDTIQYINTEIN